MEMGKAASRKEMAKRKGVQLETHTQTYIERFREIPLRFSGPPPTSNFPPFAAFLHPLSIVLLTLSKMC